MIQISFYVGIKHDKRNKCKVPKPNLNRSTLLHYMVWKSFSSMVQTFLTPIYNLLGQIKESSRIMGLFTLCPSIPDGVMNESRLLDH